MTDLEELKKALEIRPRPRIVITGLKVGTEEIIITTKADAEAGGGEVVVHDDE